MTHTPDHHATKFHQAHGRHWFHLYQRRRLRVQNIDSTQMALTQVLSLVGAIIAGMHLEENKAILAVITGTFVVLPAVFDLDGSLGMALSAKINNRLQERGAKAWRVMAGSVGFSMIIALIAGVIVSLAGGWLAAVLFDGDFWGVFRLALGAIMLSAVIGFPVIGLLSLYFRKHDINPDDVIGPVEAAFFDVLTVVTLVWVGGWLL